MMTEFNEVIDGEKAKILVEKISRIDKIEKQQEENINQLNKVVKEVDSIQTHLKENQLDGRLTKVEKRQEFVLEELKEMNKDISAVEQNCAKQRNTCLASVAPLSLVSEAKSEISRAMERFERIVIEIKNEFRTLYESSNRWNRWSLIISMVAVIIASFTMIISTLQHFPK